MIRVFKLIIMTFLLSACMIKWEMKLTVNEDLSGAYSLTTGIDEELQIFALEMVESSLGGLENVLNSVPEGYGKSFYSDEIYDGITIRNSFSNIDEFNSQLLELRSNPDTALMLIPIENIKIEKEIQERGVVYKVFGEFAEIIESEVTETDLNIPQMEYLYDLSLVLTLPGNMTSPIEINDGENIVIFEPNGRQAQTFQALSKGNDESDSRTATNLILGDIVFIAISCLVALAIFFAKKINKAS